MFRTLKQAVPILLLTAVLTALDALPRIGSVAVVGPDPVGAVEKD